MNSFTIFEPQLTTDKNHIVMKKNLLFIFIALVFSMSVSAADNAVMKFADTEHDFGTIKSTGGAVSYEYKFTNTGKEPLVIITVTNGGCGCTTPTYPKEPIAPGKTGVVKITFNPAGRRGEFNREVKVRTNVQKKRLSLKFSGVIVP